MLELRPELYLIFTMVSFFPVYVEPNKIRFFVLDEADEMLSRGFKDQIYDVFRKLPSEVQVQ